MRRALVSLTSSLTILGSLFIFSNAKATEPVDDISTVNETPLDLVIAAPEPSIFPGSGVNLQAGLLSLSDFVQVDVYLTTGGAITLGGPSLISLGPMAAGDSLTFSIPVLYGSPDSSVVHVRVQAWDGVNFTDESQSLYTLFWSGRPLTGMNGYLNLGLRGLDEDVVASVISQGRADSVADSLAAPDMNFLDLPDTTIVPVDTTGVPGPDSGVLLHGPSPSPMGNLTLQGTFRWEDENGDYHPVYGATLEIWDHETIGDDRKMGTRVTDKDGNYSITLDNNDGFGGGGLDIYFRIYSANSYARVTTAGGRRYVWNNLANRQDNMPDGTFTRDFEVPNTRNNPSWSVLTAATHAAAYARKLNGDTALPLVTVIWPTSADGNANFYRPNSRQIHLREKNQWEWDTIFHEYGHHVQHQFGMTASPGGRHTLNQPCLSNANNSKPNGVRLAWAEGWATFFGISAQKERNLAALGIPRVGDTQYENKQKGIRYDLETRDRPYKSEGEDNELAVSRALWDLYDDVDDGLDKVHMTDQDLLTRFRNAAAKTLSAAWATVRDAGSIPNDFKIADVAAEHVIAPVPNHPPDGSSLVPGSTLFWNSNVGCDTPWRGNRFQLVFYRPVPLTRIQALNDTTPSHTLTEAEIQTLIGLTGADRKVLWAVEGSQNGNPATGPYLGTRLSAVLELPVPLVVERFEALSRVDGLELQWSLPAGVDAIGFRVERSEAEGDPFLPVWSAEARGGGEYAYLDDRVTEGHAYTYRLDLVMRDGSVVEAGLSTARFTRPFTTFRLEAPSPNPTRSSTEIALELPRSDEARLQIFDLRGALIRTLEDGRLPAGAHRYAWDGRDDQGRRAPSGLYLVRAVSSAGVRTCRVVVAR